MTISQTAARQTATLRQTGHRPWLLPTRPWAQAQTWENLLFAHWRVEAADLRPHLPARLRVEEFNGSAWLGITPFRVSGLRLRALPPLPLLSRFLELNVRTYVTLDRKPGIWFFSLDASSWPAVTAARRTSRLPYHRARMSTGLADGAVDYRSERRSPPWRYRFRATYRPIGPREHGPEPGSAEQFLTERYCLYSEGPDGTLLRADIHHPPWPLRAAEAEIHENTMPPDGMRLHGEPVFHFASRQDVIVWWPEPVHDSTHSAST